MGEERGLTLNCYLAEVTVIGVKTSSMCQRKPGVGVGVGVGDRAKAEWGESQGGVRRPQVMRRQVSL